MGIFYIIAYFFKSGTQAKVIFAFWATFNAQTIQATCIVIPTASILACFTVIAFFKFSSYQLIRGNGAEIAACPRATSPQFSLQLWDLCVTNSKSQLFDNRLAFSTCPHAVLALSTSEPRSSCCLQSAVVVRIGGKNFRELNHFAIQKCSQNNK